MSENLNKLKSDHFGIEIIETGTKGGAAKELKSDHFGIEILCTHIHSDLYLAQLKSDHFGIEIHDNIIKEIEEFFS